MTWTFAFVFGCCTVGLIASLYFYLENSRDEREHTERLRQMQDEIDGIVR